MGRALRGRDDAAYLKGLPGRAQFQCAVRRRHPIEFEHIPKLSWGEHPLEPKRFLSEILHSLIHRGLGRPLAPARTIGRDSITLFMAIDFVFPALSSSSGSGG
ncbi:hypothetical protein J2129_001093 [Methanofollis sp. W23]|nr:hypothetical protein [Methanofollis sp. W23]